MHHKVDGRQKLINVLTSRIEKKQLCDLLSFNSLYLRYRV